MQKFLAVSLIFCFAVYVPFAECARPAAAISTAAWLLLMQEQQGPNDSFPLFSPEQLDNLLAPIAPYTDPLLAQVLLAATFPDQIDQADREVHATSDQYNVDSAPWDVSVKAVARYPAVLHMIADKLDWTTSLGQRPM